jgi:hypothetical protein
MESLYYALMRLGGPQIKPNTLRKKPTRLNSALYTLNKFRQPDTLKFKPLSHIHTHTRAHTRAHTHTDRARVAVPPSPVRVPRQRSHAPSDTSATSIANDNEMVPRAVSKSCLTDEENPAKP